MALSEFEAYRLQVLLQRFCRSVPVDIRSLVSFSYEIDEDEPSFQLNMVRHSPYLERSITHPFARAVYDASSRSWMLYGMGGNGHWTRHEPLEPLDTVDQVLAVIGADRFPRAFI